MNSIELMLLTVIQNRGTPITMRSDADAIWLLGPGLRTPIPRKVIDVVVRMGCETAVANVKSWLGDAERAVEDAQMRAHPLYG